MIVERKLQMSQTFDFGVLKAKDSWHKKTDLEE